MLMKGKLSSSNLAYQVRSTSLLPFLYHTSTLLPQQSPRKLRTISSISRNQFQACKSLRAANNVFNDHVFADRKSIPTHDPALPFDNVEPDFDARDAKPSTMTTSEKEAFERIFRDVQQTPNDEDEEPEGLEDEQNIETDPYEDLNAIFDAAIQLLRTREDQRVENAANRQDRPDRSYTRAIDHSVATNTPFEAATDSKEIEKEQRHACQDHKVSVSEMLERATTDVEIWGILEQHVFGLVKQFNLQLKWDETARKARERNERRATKEQTTREGDTSENIKSVHESTPKAISPVLSRPVLVPTNTLFAILQTNYADCLLSAMRLLRRRYPTSFYPFYILPTMKDLGQMSYVLGATINLYNEILFLKWTQFSDLHGMADLMQEMLNQGIEMNEITKVILRRVIAERRWSRMGKFGPIKQKWWSMRGHVEGWHKVSSIYGNVRRGDRARQEREALVIGKEEYGG